jgi:hypothetical protein
LEKYQATLSRSAYKLFKDWEFSDKFKIMEVKAVYEEGDKSSIQNCRLVAFHVLPQNF